ncbi:MAG: hypothetical protein IPN63_07725 [Gammaproteobacteria bacterium]|nr:hypothetical protein [Gammaproteobacteria bacterium]
MPVALWAMLFSAVAGKRIPARWLAVLLVLLSEAPSGDRNAYIGSALGSFLGSGIGSMFGSDKTRLPQFTTLGAGGSLGTLRDHNKLNRKGARRKTFTEFAFGIIGLSGPAPGRLTRRISKKTFDAIAAIDNALAAALQSDEITKVRAALKGFTSGVNASTCQYTRDRLIVVAKSIDERWAKSFSDSRAAPRIWRASLQSLCRFA